MKNLIFLFILSLGLKSNAQDAILGQWNLHYLFWNNTVVFDVENNDPEKMNNTGNLYVQEDGELKEVSNEGVYDVWKKSYFYFLDQENFEWNNVVLIDGELKNEVFTGTYTFDLESSLLKLSIYSSKTGSLMSEIEYHIKLDGAKITFTSGEESDYSALYIKQG